jgi:hypothetical protein
MIETYRPSGKFSPSFVIFALLGAAVAVASAWLYQFLMELIPLIYLNFLITAGFAFLLSMGTGAMVHGGRCRNAFVAVAAALVIGALTAGATHYFSYQSALDDIVDMEGLDEVGAEALAEQVSFGQFIEARVDMGWSFGKVGRSGDGAPISGFFVWLLWGIEGLVLVGAAGFGAFGAARSPFCESCNEWSEDDAAFIFPAPSEETLAQIRSARSVEGLLDVEIEATGMPTQGLLFKPSKCPSCPDNHHLSVCERVVTVDSDGKEDIKDTDLLTNVILTAEQAERVRAIGMGEEVPQEAEMDDWSDEALAEADAPAPSQSESTGKPAETKPEPALDANDDGSW